VENVFLRVRLLCGAVVVFGDVYEMFLVFVLKVDD
jgi:hypothetical protein